MRLCKTPAEKWPGRRVACLSSVLSDRPGQPGGAHSHASTLPLVLDKNRAALS